MTKEYRGSGGTVAELISILKDLPPTAPVRVPTMECTYAPDVYLDDQGEFGKYVILEQ
jgi:hypothetical protein